MNKNDYNKNAVLKPEKIDENERLKRRTVQRMFDGAREEQRRFNELQKLKKELKNQLQVLRYLNLLCI